MHARPRRRTILSTQILVVPVLAVMASCGGGSTASSRLPIKDDFSDCARGWSTDNDQSVTLKCTGGRYSFLVKEAGPEYSRLFFKPSVEALSVEADATQGSGPKTFGDEALELHGILCWGSGKTGSATGYFFGVTPDGHVGILRAMAG